MKEPSNPPVTRLHDCDSSGLPPVYDYYFEIDPYEDDLRVSIAREASNRVMFAVHRLSFGLHQQLDMFAERNMASEAFHEFQQYSSVLADLNVNKLSILEDVISKIMINLPSTIETLEEMLSRALVQSGFCCDLAADELVSEVDPVFRTGG